MMYPVYKKCLEIFIVDIDLKFYRLGIDYEYTEFKGKMFLKVNDVFLKEVEGDG